MAEKRLIDADAFCKSNVFVCGGFAEEQYWNGYTDALDRVEEALEYFPEVDAVEVVRCRDCAKRGLFTCPICFIENKTLQFINLSPDFYCGEGERKDGGGNG